ncbi:MAG: 4Fe-4S binding protein [Clostridiales bacterium]|nr:4Fe-4S binding protein [Clostridiales bacterium]
MIRLTFDTERCKACELCAAVCPKHILALNADLVNLKGYHPMGCIDMASCIACASCAKMCPDSVITIEKI